MTDENGLSYGPYVLQHHQAELMKAWAVVHEAVVDSSTEPFVKANGGETAYGIYGKKPEMNELMLKAMSGVSVPFMKAVLDGYDGFKGVERLVDVGGSAGDCLRMILQKHSHIKEGVNFDLPEVVAKAPKIDGQFCFFIFYLFYKAPFLKYIRFIIMQKKLKVYFRGKKEK